MKKDLAEEYSQKQARFYGDLYAKHGASVEAVASGKPIYKDLRYDKLCGVFADDSSEEISLHDVGFGLGHLQQFISRKCNGRRIVYSGSEVTPAFVEYARRCLQGQFFLRDISKEAFAERYNYLIFGGTFYHLAGARPEDYTDYVYETLKNAYAMCSKGIAFNLITEFVDYHHDDLFYADLPRLLHFLVNNLSRFVVIKHDYPLFEYTVYLYRYEFIKSQYEQKAFDKYLL